MGDILRFTTQWTMGLPRGDGLVSTVASFGGAIGWQVNLFDVAKAKTFDEVRMLEFTLLRAVAGPYAGELLLGLRRTKSWWREITQGKSWREIIVACKGRWLMSPAPCPVLRLPPPSPLPSLPIHSGPSRGMCLWLLGLGGHEYRTPPLSPSPVPTHAQVVKARPPIPH